jgi:PIN domain nuclease of toxin-antitoxin system
VRLLLDTYAFLWWVADDERLSRTAAAAIADGGNEVFVSAASAWEVVVKAGLGRLEVPEPVDRWLPDQLERNAFAPLPITMGHALGLSSLPPLHRDPFDRVLVAQAVHERMALVSGDGAFSGYPVEVVW